VSADSGALHPLFVPPAGEPIKARAAGTGGALGLVETVIPAGHSTALHVHRHEDECMYVLTGTVDLVCGDKRFRAEAGAFVFLPRGIPHTFLGMSEAPAHVLILFLPGGLEAAFAEPRRFHEILREHDVEAVGPSLTAVES
jgi:mannose-6-phosphate isomerase-like protein (cupin superfamily)